MKILHRAAFLLALVLCTGPTFAQAVGQTEWLSTDTVHSQITADSTTVTPGQTLTLAWNVRLDPEWHIYYQNPGDSGIAPLLSTSLAGATMGPLQFPTPHLIRVPPITNYGYANQVILIASLTLPKTLPTGPLSLPQKHQNLKSSDVCMPGQLTATLPLTVGSAPVANPAFPALLAQHHATMPAPLPAGISLHATRAENTVTLTLNPGTLGKPTSLLFIPASEGWLHDSAPQTYQNNTLTLQVDPHTTSSVTSIQGLLVLPNGKGYVLPPTPISPAGGLHSQTDTGPAPVFGLFTALAFALLAGLILNVMPCVLPVLSLKVMGLAGSRGHLLSHTLFYTTGILAAFWSFAALITTLRHGGQALGWGFHLQNPTFVAALTLVLVAVALYFFGVFSFGARATQAAQIHPKNTPAGAFLTGVLAVVVATPCTVPFMGTAMAYALTQGTFAAFAVFTALGLGMALPFILISLIPTLRHLLPKPGPWMITVRHALGWPMLATALWLAYVFTRQTHIAALFALLNAALGLSLAATVWGTHRTPRLRRPLAILIALISLTFPALLIHPVSPATTAAWKAWSPQAVTEAQTKRPIFVDFTADWCLTCKVTEATVLNTQTVQTLFAQHNVLLLKADWTTQDPAITEELAAHGRHGVPLYLLYLPESPTPRILPQLLTPGLLNDAFTNPS